MNLWQSKLKIDSITGVLKYPEFRSLMYKRLSSHSFYKRLLCYILSVLYKPLGLLYIYTKKIGMGMFFEHGYSTIISAESIGSNWHINQNVTLGWTSKGTPVIGDNVTIGAGAIVIRNINIGNYVVIGAGALITKDVAPYAIIGGNPARILKKRFNDELINGLLKIRWWDWPDEKINDNINLLCSEEVEELLIKELGEDWTLSL
jgi:serine acetyltransferase